MRRSLASGWAPFTSFAAYWTGGTAILLGDFLRRTSEFVGIFVSWIVVRSNNRERSRRAENLAVLILRKVWSSADWPAYLDAIASIGIAVLLTTSGIAVVRRSIAAIAQRSVPNEAP